jgi:hypothetical protein
MSFLFVILFFTTAYSELTEAMMWGLDRNNTVDNTTDWYCGTSEECNELFCRIHSNSTFYLVLIKCRYGEALDIIDVAFMYGLTLDLRVVSSKVCSSKNRCIKIFEDINNNTQDLGWVGVEAVDVRC